MAKKYFILFIIFLTVQASANEWPTLKQAEVEIKNHNYKSAIDLTMPLLNQLKLTTVEEIAQGHKILAAARCELGDIGMAKDHFETLMIFSPHESIQDFQLSQTCQNLFNGVMGKPAPAVRKKVKISKNTKKIPLPDETPPTLKTQNAEPQSLGNLKLQDHSQKHDIQEWKLWMPFGVGQFAKKEKKKGTIFLTTQSVLFSAAIASFVLFKGEQNPNGTFDNAGRAEIYRISLWSSLGTGLASTIWGLIDAHKPNS